MSKPFSFKRGPSTSKYRNTRITVDGHNFMSIREADRYSVLKLLERAGKIKGLRLQPRYPLVVNGHKIATMVGDFEYLEEGQIVTEDSKGVVTDVFRIKAALFKALYGRPVRVT